MESSFTTQRQWLQTEINRLLDYAEKLGTHGDELRRFRQAIELGDDKQLYEDKDIRLGFQQERERIARIFRAHSIKYRFWDLRRSTTEVVRPIARTLFAPLLPFSDTLRKKLSRPKSKSVDYVDNPSSKRPLVVHFAANFVIGGSPQLVCDIIQHTQEGFRHIVVSKHCPRPPAYRGVRLVDVGRPGDSAILRRLLDNLQPDLVHVHYWNGTLEDLVWYDSVFRLLGDRKLKVVQNVNTSGEPYFCSHVARYVFCSKWSMQSSGAPWINSEVIYPGTRVADFHRRDLSEVPDKVVGMVYRLGGDKIGRNAIEVFIQVMQRVPGASSVIVGDGDLVGYFKSRVEQEGMSERIRFTGWVSYEELKRVYQSLAVFLAPVKDDTFGSVSVFAMCEGIPVAGFGVGGIPEIVGNPELLAEPGDTERLARIVSDLLVDRQRRLRIGVENQQRAAGLFSVEAMTKAYGHLYSELLHQI